MKLFSSPKATFLQSPENDITQRIGLHVVGKQDTPLWTNAWVTVDSKTTSIVGNIIYWYKSEVSSWMIEKKSSVRVESDPARSRHLELVQQLKIFRIHYWRWVVGASRQCQLKQIHSTPSLLTMVPSQWLATALPLAAVATAAARMTGKMRKSWLSAGGSWKKRGKEVFVDVKRWTLASFQQSIDRFQTALRFPLSFRQGG